VTCAGPLQTNERLARSGRRGSTCSKEIDLRSCLGLVLLFVIGDCVIIGLGLGLGGVLHRLLPAIGLDFAALIGVVGTGATAIVACLIISARGADPRDELLDDEALEILARTIVAPVPPARSRGGKKASRGVE
jgi:hypothetical protein